MTTGPEQPPPSADQPERSPEEGTEAKEADKDRPEEEAQQPWATRRDLRSHAPSSMRFDGTNNGISAGQIIGDVKTEIHYRFGGFGSAGPVSGEITAGTLDRLAGAFVTESTRFEDLLDRLRKERVLVLTGAPFTGRRSAALMLLRRVGAAPVHALDNTTGPGELAALFDPPGRACGYVLCDLATTRDAPLREAQFNALRDLMREQEAHLVITTGLGAYLDGSIRAEAWQPPPRRAVLAAHVTRDAGEGAARSLLALPSVATFLAREPQLREVVGYATALRRYATGQSSGEELDGYPLRALKDQVREWFAEPEEIVHLRDKAFLIALAAFDGGPYALTAELSDRLYEAFQRIGDPKRHVVIPVFSTHIGKRLELARARMYPEEEDTEWGPVTQVKACFRDERAAMVVLPEVWTGHPAARPALVGWLDELANDGRPLVRTRAAATAAVLASTDLPSAMALIIEKWARSDQARRRTAAVSALTLAHRIGTPNIPRIIDGWSANADDPRPCWVAVRAHGLIGAERPVEALAALRRQARLQDGKPTPDAAVAKELPASVGLLLLSDRAETVLAELLRTLPEHRSARGLAVRGFLAACEQRDEEAGHGRPQILDWYARAADAGAPAAPGITRLMRTALDDRAHTGQAEEVLRGWIRDADRNEATEWALAALLPTLAGSPGEHSRLDHLLRTPGGDDGGPHPAVAARLGDALDQPVSV